MMCAFSYVTAENSLLLSNILLESLIIWCPPRRLIVGDFVAPKLIRLLDLCQESWRSLLIMRINSSDHFREPARMISTNDVENEFWRLLDEKETDIVVEHGADLSAGEHGWVFPHKMERSLVSENHIFTVPGTRTMLRCQEGQPCPKNIRNANSLVLAGMVFSCFCWHMKDHWSNSINYTHTGSRKSGTLFRPRQLSSSRRLRAPNYQKCS